MATIQKRGSGQWRVSRKEAETTTLAKALERFILEYAPRLAAGATDARRARKLQERKLASKMLAAIRGKDIADFIREREAEGMAANTIRLDLATLSRVFNLCRTAWGMESLGNPVQLAPRPKLPGGRQRRLEWGEEERLLDACPPGFRPVVLLALETAMRRAEIAGLTFHDLRHEATSRLFENTDLDSMGIKGITGHEPLQRAWASVFPLPQACNRHGPEPFAERHNVCAAVEHHAGLETLAQ